MKRYEVKKTNRDFGEKCDWYNKKNLHEVKEMNPTVPCGNRQVPAAYFVEIVKEKYNEMFGWETHRKAVAGPFSCETVAKEWMAMH